MAAADTARLVAELSLKDNLSPGVNSALKGVNKLDSSLSRIGKTAQRGVSTAAGNLAKLGAIAGGGLVAGLVASVKAASDLAENQSKVNVVFGESADVINAWAKTSVKAFGATESEALGYAGTLGNLFDALGLTQKQQVDMSKGTVQLAADLASFNNLAGGTEEALEKLRAGLVGEAEPLRSLGVNINAAAVEAKVLALGLADTKGEITDAMKVQARYALIMEQTTNAQGDFARTSGGLANQIRMLKGQLGNAAATIGTALIPRVTELAVKLNDAIAKNQPAIQAFADKLPAAFDKVFSAAERIPWGAIGDGLKAGAFWAEKLFDAFIALPPEVQTTIIALAGLNKLSGGAITGIVGELGKGLIKGYLNLTAGVVNVNAKTLAGAGGAGAAAGGAAKGGSTIGRALSAVTKVFMVGAAVGVFAELTGVLNRQSAENTEALNNFGSQVDKFAGNASLADLRGALNEMKAGDAKLRAELTPEAIAYQLNIDGVADRVRHDIQTLEAAVIREAENTQGAQDETTRAINVGAAITTSTLNQTKASVIEAGLKAQRAGDKTAAAASAAGRVARSGGVEAAVAIRKKDLSVTVQHSTTVKATQIINGRIFDASVQRQYIVVRPGQQFQES